MGAASSLTDHHQPRPARAAAGLLLPGLPNRVGSTIIFMPARPGNVVPPLHRKPGSPFPDLGSTDALAG